MCMRRAGLVGRRGFVRIVMLQKEGLAQLTDSIRDSMARQPTARLYHRAVRVLLAFPDIAV